MAWDASSKQLLTVNLVKGNTPINRWKFSTSLSIGTTARNSGAPLGACPQNKISRVNFVSSLGNKGVSLIRELVILLVDTFFPLPHLLAALLRIGYMIVYTSKCFPWYVLGHWALLYTLLFLLTPSLFKVTAFQLVLVVVGNLSVISVFQIWVFRNVL